MYRIGWFSSGRGPGSRALLTAMQESIKNGDVQAEISFAFCNREPGQSGETDLFLDLVEEFNLPLVCHSSQKFRSARDASSMSAWRTDYDHEVLQRLEHFKVDLCVLAGYMLIVGADLCQHFPMINLHPALPGGPKGTWKEVIWQLIESRAERTGAMMHLVTPELDEGPPLTYCSFSIRGYPFDDHWRKLEKQSLEEIRAKDGEDMELFRLIRQHGLSREIPLIVSTVRACSTGKVMVRDGEIIDSYGHHIMGYDLSAEIDTIVEASS